MACQRGCGACPLCYGTKGDDERRRCIQQAHDEFLLALQKVTEEGGDDRQTGS